MKVALIPPRKYTELIRDDTYQLFLANEFRYGTYDKLQARELSSAYRIMDNGEAEGQAVGHSVLLDAALAVGADEVVVPDKMLDASATILAAQDFGRHLNGEDRAFSFGGVVQGLNTSDCLRCLMAFVDLEYITVLYIPRCLGDNIDKYFRVHFIESVYDKLIRGRFTAIHALGCTKWPEEVLMLKRLPYRGIDTSMPYVMAMRGETLDSDVLYHGREEDYAESTMSNWQMNIARTNIRTFKSWAGDDGEALLR